MKLTHENVSETTIERVVDNSTAKTFPVKAVLAILDSPHLTFNFMELNVDNPVPVYSADRKILGYASVFVEGNKLLAEGSIDYASPERLSIETNSEKLYLGLFEGFVDSEPMYSSDVDLYGCKSDVFEIVVGSLRIAPYKPQDDRLEPVGKPVL